MYNKIYYLVIPVIDSEYSNKASYLYNCIILCSVISDRLQTAWL